MTTNSNTNSSIFAIPANKFFLKKLNFSRIKLEMKLITIKFKNKIMTQKLYNK